MFKMPHLKVLHDPEFRGLHPNHEHRFIATEDAEWQESGKSLERGSVVCGMRDVDQIKETAWFLVTASNYHYSLMSFVRSLADPKCPLCIARGTTTTHGSICSCITKKVAPIITERLKSRLSIRDALLLAISNGKKELDAIEFVRGVVNCKKVSTLRMKEYYRQTLKEYESIH